MKIAQEFRERWNFPNCVGAMDGKHIQLKQPPKSGSYYFNYKGTFSIVLLAVVDANYKFAYIDVGCNGRISDGGVYRNSSLSTAINNDLLGIPSPKLVGDTELPFVIVADDAFPLKPNIMKPYASRGLTREKRIFNYRLSRARRISENAFGILANRFRVFLTPMQLSTESAEKAVLASCALHNFLRENSPNQYTPSGTFDIEDLETGIVQEGSWRSENLNSFQSIRVTGASNYAFDAKDIREEFCRYFSSEEGMVPWQDKFI